jgi:adenylate cyclase
VTLPPDGVDSQLTPEHEAGALFAEAERRSESALAYLRLAGFIVLLLLLRVFDVLGPDHAVWLPLVLYGLATMVSLALAVARLHWRWLPALFTTLDVGLVLHFMSMLVLHAGLSATDALAVPGTLMIFLVLSQAAVRYRPALIVYAAGLFVLGWAGVHAVEMAVNGGQAPHWRSPELAHIALVILTAIALLIASIRARRLLLTSVVESRLRADLSRFVPSTLVTALSSQHQDPRLPHSQPVGVLFVDIRGFTSRAEDMPPAELLAFLSDYRQRMSAPVFAQRGMIDKFIGDAVMAVFGLPEASPDDAARALRCGLEMLEALERWNGERGGALEPVRVSIGIHFGDAIVGAIGWGERLEYTVIGDTVNLAQRIERLSAELDVPLLVSEETLRTAEGSAEAWTEVAHTTVRGRHRPVRLYAPTQLR